MKIQQLIVQENDIQVTDQQSALIDSVPGLRPWLNYNNIHPSNIEVHPDKSITILGNLEGFAYGSATAQHFPTVIRRVAGDVIMFIENNNFQESPKLNIHKWIKQVDGEFGVNIYDPTPLLSFLNVKIGRSLDIQYYMIPDDGDLKGQDPEVDEELCALMNTMSVRGYDVLEAQQEMLDAGYGKFARM